MGEIRASLNAIAYDSIERGKLMMQERKEITTGAMFLKGQTGMGPSTKRWGWLRPQDRYFHPEEKEGQARGHKGLRVYVVVWQRNI